MMLAETVAVVVVAQSVGGVELIKLAKTIIRNSCKLIFLAIRSLVPRHTLSQQIFGSMRKGSPLEELRVEFFLYQSLLASN